MAKAKVSADTVTTTIGDGVEEKQINVTVQLPSDVKTSGNTMKYIGRSSDMDNGYADTVTYLSVRKEMMLFGKDENEIIQFKGRLFTTNREDHMEYIEKNGMFGQEIFKGEFPPHIMKRLQEDEKYLTKDKDEYAV